MSQSPALLDAKNSVDLTDELRFVTGGETKSYDTKNLDTALIAYALGWKIVEVKVNRSPSTQPGFKPRAFGHFFFEAPKHVSLGEFEAHLKNKTLVLRLEVMAFNQLRHDLKRMVQEKRASEDAQAQNL